VTPPGRLLQAAVERLLLRSAALQAPPAATPAGDAVVVGPTDLTILVWVSCLDRATTSTVAAEIGLDRSQVSRRVDGLTAAGLLRRDVDGTDARAVLLVLTGRGGRLLARHRAAQARRLDVLTAQWAPESVAALVDGISRLVDELAPNASPEPAERRPAPDADAGPARLSAEERQVWRSVLESADLVRTRVTQDLTPATGLTQGDFLVLTRLSDFPGHSRSGLKALAATMGWSPSRLSHQLKRMETRELIVRQVDDAGTVTITMTPRAAESLDEATALHAASVRRHLLSRLTAAEGHTVVTIADRIARQG
jgi:DNA-binding MarR family transcriptional regulator